MRYLIVYRRVLSGVVSRATAPAGHRGPGGGISPGGGGGRKQSAAPASDELRARTATELTQREREILSLLTEGGRNKAIARRLDITEGTVKVPMKGILG